jgi:hypothetical protein
LVASQGENSEVLPVGSVAVAVMTLPAGTGNDELKLIVALPLASVVTFVVSKKLPPSPFPEESHAPFE